jgi:hypothetical protein
VPNKMKVSDLRVRGIYSPIDLTRWAGPFQGALPIRTRAMVCRSVAIDQGGYAPNQRPLPGSLHPDGFPTGSSPSPQTRQVIELSQLGRELEVGATTEEIRGLRNHRIHD